MTTYNADMQQRRDTAANWTSGDPTLLAGEIGVETDTGKKKVGDGSTAWTSLDYDVTAYDLEELADVTVTSGTEDDVVQLKSGVWVNRTVAQLLADGAVDDIGDVDLSGGATGDLLVKSAAGGVETIDSGTYQAQSSYWLDDSDTTNGFYMPAGLYPSGNNVAMTLNRMYAVAFEIGKAGYEPEQLRFRVATAGTNSQVRFGLYTPAANGLPDALVGELGTQSSTATGNKKFAVTNGVSMSAGIMWLAFVAQDDGGGGASAPTLTGSAGFSPFVRPDTNLVIEPKRGYLVDGVSGALPASFGTPSADDAIPAVSMNAVSS